MILIKISQEYAKRRIIHMNLIFFCKTHNKLCCGFCITKVKGKDFGQHSDCEVCLLEEIENEKKDILKQNIKILEELSNGFGKTIEDLKIKLEEIKKIKEEIKIKVLKIFNNITNALNERKDKLFEIIDNKFDELYFDKNKNVINEEEKIANKIEIYLKIGKLIDNQWKDNKLNYLINNCITIENNIKDINIINNKVEKFKKRNINICFNSNDSEIIEKIKYFGKIEEDPKKEINYELIKSYIKNNSFNSKLFIKTKDGSPPNDLDNKYDNKSTTKTFIESEKEYKVRDHTELKWDNDSYTKKDKSNSIFHFDNKQKSNPRNDIENFNSDDWLYIVSDQEEKDFENKNLNDGWKSDNEDLSGKYNNNNSFLGRKKNNDNNSN